MERAPGPAGAPGRANLPPLSNGPAIASGAPGMHNHPFGAPRPPDPPRQPRCGSRPLTARTRSCSPLRAADPRTWLPAAALASSRAAAVRPFLRSGAARAAPLSEESRGGAAPEGVQPSGGRAGSSSLPGPRLRPPHAPPPAPRLAAPRPEPRARAHGSGGRKGLKGPDVCGRFSLARSRPPPLRPATHALAAAGPPPGSANFYFDRRWRVGGAAGDVQDPRAQRTGVRSLRRGGAGDPAEPPSARGSVSLFFLFFFSLPPPGFKGTAPAKATGQAAAVSPVSRRPLRPGQTRSHRSASPELQGVFRRTPDPGQPGCRAWFSLSMNDF